MSSKRAGLGSRALAAGDKRERLLDAAERAFCRLGYARTTIAELATEVGVSRPTVYAYFASKDEVFRALADRVRREFLELQETVDTSAPERTVREALAGYLATYTRHRDIITLIAHQALNDPAMRELHDDIFARVERRNARFLQRLLDNGQAQPAVPAAKLSAAVTGIVARFAELAPTTANEHAQLAEELSRLYLRMAGLGPDGGGT